MIIIIDEDEIYDIQDESDIPESRFEMTRRQLKLTEEAEAAEKKSLMLSQAKEDFKKMLIRETAAINTRLQMIEELAKRF